MGAQQDNMWSANMDGELSAAEAAAFDQSLTSRQKSALAAEIKLERKIAERIVRDVACPEAAWKRTLALVEQQAAASRARKARPRWAYAMASAAAVIGITLAGASFWSYYGPPSSILAMDRTESVTSLTQQAELRGASTAEVNAFFKEHGFAFAMSSANLQGAWGGRHEREMIGVLPVTYRGEPVMELLFNCCGKPIKVIVAKSGGRVAAEIGDAVAKGQVQASKPVGAYVAAEIGPHKSPGLLDYLTDASV